MRPMLLFALALLVAACDADDQDPEAPEVTDCDVPQPNETFTRADQCLFINITANNVRAATPPPAQMPSLERAKT